VGVHDELKGEVPRAFVVLKAGSAVDAAALAQEVRDAVRAGIGPVASLKQVDVLAKLPKTRSGKVLRGTIRALANGGDPAVPATIEDASVLDDLRRLLTGPR
jgi:propionyl-CoA synthetase